MIQVLVIYLFLMSLYSNKLHENNFTVLIESKYQGKYIHVSLVQIIFNK